MLGMESDSDVVKALKASGEQVQSTEGTGNAPEPEETNTEQHDLPAGDAGIRNEPKAEKSESKPDGVQNGGKPKWTPEQKRNEAWARLRKKTKAQEAEIARLTKLLEEQGRPKTGETEDERIERIAERGVNKSRLETLKTERTAANNELFEALVAEQFAGEKAQAAFRESWEIGERNGTHRKINGDAVVRNFLAKSRLTPRLVHHFALKPEALDRILDIDDDDRKKFELFGLEQRLSAFLAEKERANRSTGTAKEQPKAEQGTTAREILEKQVKTSVIGRQTAGQGVPANQGLSDKDIENIVNRNRFGGLGFRG